MAQENANAPWSPEPFRGYLHLIVGLHANEFDEAKLDPSGIVQETMILAHRHQGTFRGTSEQEYRGWLRAILLQVLATRLRLPGGGKTRRRQGAIAGGGPGEILTPPGELAGGGPIFAEPAGRAQ